MQLTDSIYLVGGGAWGGMGLSPGPDCNVYLVNGGHGLALIDAGSGVAGSVEAIAATIASHGFALRDIRMLVLTHMHGDHVGGAARLAELAGAEVYGSLLTAAVLAAGDEKAAAIDVARTAGVFPADFALMKLAAVHPLSDGDVLALGNLNLRVIDTPGHSAGHISILAEGMGRRDLFAGDAVFWRGRILFQPIIGCDVEAGGHSLQRLAGLGTIDGLFSGHGAFTISGANRHLDAAASQARALQLPPAL